MTKSSGRESHEVRNMIVAIETIRIDPFFGRVRKNSDQNVRYQLGILGPFDHVSSPWNDEFSFEDSELEAETGQKRN